MTSPHYFEEEGLSAAWEKAMTNALEAGGEIGPLIVGITAFDGGAPRESSTLRHRLDDLLSGRKAASIETVASTIFPRSLWNPERDRSALYERYLSIYPRVRMLRANRNGTYFGRMIAGDREPKNQLEFAISSYLHVRRRSKLQIALFDPATDHKHDPYLGFPCLQHVSFAPTDSDGLSVTALYTMQYLVQKAYGNYLGLARLGHFVATQLGRRLTRVTCVAGIAQVEKKIGGRGLRRSDLDALMDTARDVLSDRGGDG